MSRPFYTPRSDRRALIALALAAALVAGALTGKFWQNRNSNNTTAQEQTPQPGTPPAPTDSANKQRQLQPFDPNNVSAEQLIQMGFSKRQAYSLLAARERGHVFRSVYDVLTVYGWEDEDLQQMEQVVTIADTYKKKRTTRASPQEYTAYDTAGNAAEQTEYPQRNKFREHTLVNPNTADTTLLMRIPGIGPYFAQQIVGRRERLGGFADIEQLLEIDRFPEQTLDWFEIDSVNVRQIHLPSAPLNDLGHHPYIGWRKAKALTTYQRLYGPILSIDELRNTHLFSEDTLAMLEPYLQWADSLSE